MNTISVVIITFNEEKNIERCLKSVKTVADEIIVVDSFSTDKTKETCVKYKVQFIERKWEGYSITKNFANSQAKSDYILSIDADEALSPELTEALMDLKKKSSTASAYRVCRLTNYCGKWIKHGGWYPDKKIRLWKNGFALWEGCVHENLVFNNNVIVKDIKGDLYHYTFHTIEQHTKQVNKFTEIAAENDFKRGRKTNIIKILIYPKWKFLRDYFIKLGFLDGYYGYIVSKISSHASFLKYVKLFELQRKNSVN